MKENVIIIGAGGHGKVVADIAIMNGCNILGFLDDDTQKVSVMGFEVLGRIMDIARFSSKAKFIIAIGDNSIRKEVAEAYDVNWCTLIHSKAVIGSEVKVGEGTVVMADAVINTSAMVGSHCIINTGAIVEHDNSIGDFVHLSPRTVLAGGVNVGFKTHIGTGAVINNNIYICEDCIIGSGAVVVKNIYNPGTYVGVPARRIIHGQHIDIE